MRGTVAKDRSLNFDAQRNTYRSFCLPKRRSVTVSGRLVVKRASFPIGAVLLIPVLPVICALFLLPSPVNAYRLTPTRVGGISKPIQALRYKRMNIQLRQQMRSLTNRQERRAIDRAVNQLRRARQSPQPRSGRGVNADAGGDSVPDTGKSGPVRQMPAETRESEMKPPPETRKVPRAKSGPL